MSLPRPARPRAPIIALAFTLFAPLEVKAQDTPAIPPPPAPAPAAKPAPAPAPAPSEPTLPPGMAEPPPAPVETSVVPPPSPTAPAAVTPAPAMDMDSTLRLAPTPTGETGLLRLAVANGAPKGTLRLSFGFDVFSAGDFIEAGDSSSRVGGTLSISVGLLDYLEAWLNLRAQSTRSTLTNPALLQAQGDFTFGAKGYYPVADVFSAGVDLQVTLLSGVGDSSFSFDGAQFQMRALASLDLRKSEAKVPLRAHLNLGFVIDGSNNLITSPLSNAERFALGVSEFNRLVAGIGVEVPVKYVTPYLEYGLEVPLDYLATPGIVITAAQVGATTQGLRLAQVAEPGGTAPVARPAIQRVLPQRITPGVRVTALRDVTFDFAVAIGLTPDVGAGVIPVPPYEVWLSASYQFDPFTARATGGGGPPVLVPVLVPEVREVEAKSRDGFVMGLVTSKIDGAPLDGVILSFDRSAPVATSENGRFLSHAIQPGPLTITARKEGYEGAISKLDVDGGGTQEIKLELTPSIREGFVNGRVLDEGGKAIGGAVIEVLGKGGGQSATTGDRGDFNVRLREGEYVLMATSEGRMRRGKKVAVKGSETTQIDIVLRSRPKTALVEIQGEEVVLRQRPEFSFETSKLDPSAAPVLDAVVDLLLSRPDIKKVRVEAHTDNSAPEDQSMTQSSAWADAVARYLVDAGIEPSRVSAEGRGSTRPIAPNLTRRGREQNKRIEIHLSAE